MGRRAVDAGAVGGPFAFLIPAEQYDPFTTARLQELLMLGGVEIHRTLPTLRRCSSGNDIPLAALCRASRRNDRTT
jgi:hypothetical protein